MVTILATIGAVLMYGSVGALECGTINFTQFFLQIAISINCFAFAYIGYEKKK